MAEQNYTIKITAQSLQARLNINKLNKSIIAMGGDINVVNRNVAATNALFKSGFSTAQILKLRNLAKRLGVLFGQLARLARQAGTTDLDFGKLTKGSLFSKGITDGIIGSLKTMIPVVGAATVAQKALNFAVGSYKEFELSLKQQRKLEAVIKATGNAAGFTGRQLDIFATQLSKTIGQDDLLIKQNLITPLLTFRNISGLVFKEAIKLGADMNSVMGGDGIVQLGKALNDPIKGIKALTRVGVMFTDQQKEQIKTLQLSGDIIGAQKIILELLKNLFGGAALAGATSSEKLKTAWGNFKLNFGGKIAPVVNSVLDSMAKSFNSFSDALDDARLKAVKNISEFDALVVSLQDLKSKTTLTTTLTLLLKMTIGQLRQKFPDYFKDIDLLKGKYNDLATAIGKARQLLLKKMQASILEGVVLKNKQELINLYTELFDIRLQKNKDILTYQSNMQKSLGKVLKELQKGYDGMLAGYSYRIGLALNKINKVKGIIDATVIDLKSLGIQDIVPPNDLNGTGNGTGTGNKVTSLLITLQKAAYEVLKIDAKMYKDRIDYRIKFNDDMQKLQKDLVNKLKVDVKDPLEGFTSDLILNGETSEETEERYRNFINTYGLYTSIVTGFASSIGNAFSAMIVYGLNFGKSMHRMFKNLIADIIATITKMLVLESIIAILSALLPGSGFVANLGKAFGATGFGSLKSVGKNASGTRNWPGGLSLVGLQGPLLVYLPKGSDVYNNSDTMGMLNYKDYNNDIIGTRQTSGISVLIKRMLAVLNAIYETRIRTTVLTPSMTNRLNRQGALLALVL